MEFKNQFAAKIITYVQLIAKRMEDGYEELRLFENIINLTSINSICAKSHIS